MKYKTLESRPKSPDVTSIDMIGSISSNVDNLILNEELDNENGNKKTYKEEQ